MEKLIIFAFILLILQGVLSFKQIKNYRNRVTSLSKKGLLGIGTEKGTLKAGNITLLVCNKEGKIVTAEKMEGITVFTRFKEMEDLSGRSILDIKNEYINKKNKPGKKAMLQAIEKLEEMVLCE